jgi:hypothetical protein
VLVPATAKAAVEDDRKMTAGQSKVVKAAPAGERLPEETAHRIIEPADPLFANRIFLYKVCKKLAAYIGPVAEENSTNSVAKICCRKSATVFLLP